MGLIDAIGARRTYLTYAVEGGTPYDETLSRYFAHLSSEGEAVTSTLTLAEVLVKPFADRSLPRQRAFRSVVQTHAGLTVVPVSEAILIEAARLRVTTRLKLPRRRPRRHRPAGRLRRLPHQRRPHQAPP